jgi:ribosomal protein S18 acetylase RimI-like enzyme
VAARAAERGAREVYLQVEAANAPGLALYARLGFSRLHDYDYRIAPA